MNRNEICNEANKWLVADSDSRSVFCVLVEKGSDGEDKISTVTGGLHLYMMAGLVQLMRDRQEVKAAVVDALLTFKKLEDMEREN